MSKTGKTEIFVNRGNIEVNERNRRAHDELRPVFRVVFPDGTTKVGNHVRTAGPVEFVYQPGITNSGGAMAYAETEHEVFVR